MDKVTASRGELLRWLKSAVGEDTDSCVDWPFRSLTRGYPVMNYRGKRWRVAHVVLDLTAQSLPVWPMTVARHLCGNQLCVNPRHLKVGTQLENIADKRTHGTEPLGEQRSNAKLSLEAVREIRSTPHRRGSDTAFARRFGVSSSAIHQARVGKSWKSF